MAGGLGRAHLHLAAMPRDRHQPVHVRVTPLVQRQPTVEAIARIRHPQIGLAIDATHGQRVELLSPHAA